MSFLLVHLFAGALAGGFFRVQTLVALALLVLVEVIWGLAANGVAAVFLWAFAAETVLQLGYLAGIYARSVVARSDLAFPTTKGTAGPSAR
jgi:hypothetical protein